MTHEPVPETYPSGIRKPDVEAPHSKPEVMILTGMSGAGRTRAAAVLADLGWYVVDNLPPQMLANLVTMVGRDSGRKLAAVVDVRGGEFFQDLEAVMDDLQARDVPVTLIFLDASDHTLVSRYEEARRRHPLQQDGTILEGIARERTQLANVRERADNLIDTSTLNVHQLRDRVTAEVAAETPRIHVNVLSFGFKNGIPADADFIADVRFLLNPHWNPELRPLTGLEPAVRDHVLSDDGAQAFLDAYAHVIDIALNRYRANDKSDVTIGVGCTGGKHRSVAMAEALGDALRELGYSVRTTHRDRPTDRDRSTI
ncbi:RNase adapter RapZ [Demequina oxidasica]|uniref:RNase adapter RapZ n=1 Tax=Demequina oxidasica TaxID=676199 RepID=UPI00078127A0|nr:RNase adapter RapZ [Demequina oxidasica]